MKQAFSEYGIWCLGDGRPSRRTDRLVEEDQVQIVAKGNHSEVLMATPGMERELAAGFCVTMGWADPALPACKVKWHSDTKEVSLDIAPPMQKAAAVKATSGGTLSSCRAEKAQKGHFMEARIFMSLTDAMSQNQVLFRQTGATHAAGLFDIRGELLVLAEDAGRHNALDKAVGSLWLENRLNAAKAAAFSGRMSLEMVLKSARAGLVFIVGVSAPTAAAVRAAHDLGLTLAGFARKGRMNLYTHAENLLSQNRPFIELNQHISANMGEAERG
jgi:FdhD protein